MTRGAQIRSARLAREWSLTTLSEKTGLTLSLLSRLENDQVGVTAQHWFNLRGVLNLRSEPPYEGRLPLPPAAFRVPVPKLKSTAVRPWQSRLRATREVFGDAVVSRCLSAIARRPDRLLCYHFLEQITIDSAWEQLPLLRFLAAGAKPAWYPPLAAGFRRLPVVDSRGLRQIGDLRHPCLSYLADGLQLLLFPQLTLQTQTCAYRLDGLVLVRRGRRKAWIDLEIDGPAHNVKYDHERQLALGLPTLRLRRQNLGNEHLLQLMTNALGALLDQAA